MILIKAFEPQDYDFLMDMQYESIFIEQDKPPKCELLQAPAIRKYNEDWGRSGDRALLAWSDITPVGAAWYRLFDETNPGYGFVDGDTPEIGLALIADFRQKGIGRLLMKNLIELASAEGYRALSLSVDPGNRAAVRLYEGLGFEYCGMSGTSWTMKLIFNPSPNE